MKTMTSSSKTQSHQPTGSSQSFDNSQFINPSGANYQSILDSNQPNFLSNFNDISIPYLKTSSTGVFTPGIFVADVGLKNQANTGQIQQGKQFQAAAVGIPRHGEDIQVHSILGIQQKKQEFMMQDQGLKRLKGEQNSTEVSDVNQIKALRNLISSMQSNGANNSNQHPMPLKNTISTNSVLSDTRECHIGEAQDLFKEVYISENRQYSHLSKDTNTSGMNFNQVTFSSSQWLNDNFVDNKVSQQQSCSYEQNYNYVNSIASSHEDYLQSSNTFKCFNPIDQSQQNVDCYQSSKHQPPILPILNGSLKQDNNKGYTSSYLQSLVSQSQPIDINSTLKQLINQLNQNTQKSSQSKNEQDQQTINEKGVANFQAKNENQQQLKNHMLRNLSHINQNNIPYHSQTDNEQNQQRRKREVKYNSKRVSDNSSENSNHNSEKESSNKHCKIVSNEKMNTKLLKQKEGVCKNNKVEDKNLYDLIENKNMKRNVNSIQQTCSNNQQKQKYQMVDKSSELKRRRLQLSSFRSNPTFHTSGNRFVPIIPQSILGSSIKSKNNKNKI